MCHIFLSWCSSMPFLCSTLPAGRIQFFVLLEQSTLFLLKKCVCSFPVRKSCKWSHNLFWPKHYAKYSPCGRLDRMNSTQWHLYKQYEGKIERTQQRINSDLYLASSAGAQESNRTFVACLDSNGGELHERLSPAREEGVLASRQGFHRALCSGIRDKDGVGLKQALLGQEIPVVLVVEQGRSHWIVAGGDRIACAGGALTGELHRVVLVQWTVGGRHGPIRELVEPIAERGAVSWADGMSTLEDDSMSAVVLPGLEREGLAMGDFTWEDDEVVHGQSFWGEALRQLVDGEGGIHHVWPHTCCRGHRSVPPSQRNHYRWSSCLSHSNNLASSHQSRSSKNM